MERIILDNAVIEIEKTHLELFAKDFCRGSRDKPSRKLFDKFVKFNDHYQSADIKVQKMLDDLETIYGTKLRAAQSGIKEWCDLLIIDITSPEEIIKFIDLAEVCGNNVMYTLAVMPMVNDVNTLSVEEFRKKYRTENDFTESELATLQEEDQIWKTIPEY